MIIQKYGNVDNFDSFSGSDLLDMSPYFVYLYSSNIVHIFFNVQDTVRHGTSVIEWSGYTLI